MISKYTNLTRLSALALSALSIDFVLSFIGILTEYLILTKLIYVPCYFLLCFIAVRDSIRVNKEHIKNTIRNRNEMLKSQFEREYTDFCREMHSK